MAKHIGIKLPDDLLQLLKTERVVAVLATFSEKGLPHTTPIQCLYPKGNGSLLFSIHKDHAGYHNMVWQKKIVFCIMGEGNIAYSILGRAGVVRAPSLVHPLMHVVRVDTIDIKSDRSVVTRIDSGVQWSFTSPEAEELTQALMNELKELALVL
jgi:hypothetical protein